MDAQTAINLLKDQIATLEGLSTDNDNSDVPIWQYKPLMENIIKQLQSVVDYIDNKFPYIPHIGARHE